MCYDTTTHDINAPCSTSVIPPPPVIEFPCGQRVQGHVIDLCCSPTESDSDREHESNLHSGTIRYDSEQSREIIEYQPHSDSKRWYCSHQVRTNLSLADVDRIVHAGEPTPLEKLSIYAPAPTPVREYVGVLSPNPHIKRRDALIAIGQLRGIKTPYDSSFRNVQSAIDQLELPSVPDIASARKRVAAAGADVERLRERIAMLRGRMAVYREIDATTEVAETEVTLKNAIRTLSEASTEEVAATQRLAQLMDAARIARDSKERRLSLIDRRQNVERRIRAAVFDTMKTEFDHIRQTPWIIEGINTDDDHTSALGDAIAIVSLAPLRAPLIVAESVATAFGGASTLAINLDATMIVGTATM